MYSERSVFVIQEPEQVPIDMMEPISMPMPVDGNGMPVDLCALLQTMNLDEKRAPVGNVFDSHYPAQNLNNDLAMEEDLHYQSDVESECSASSRSTVEHISGTGTTYPPTPYPAPPYPTATAQPAPIPTPVPHPHPQPPARDEHTYRHGCAYLQSILAQILDSDSHYSTTHGFPTTGGEYVETIFTHREIFNAHPVAHRDCARGFSDIAYILERRAWRADREADTEAVAAFRHEAWMIANSMPSEPKLDDVESFPVRMPASVCIMPMF